MWYPPCLEVWRHYLVLFQILWSFMSMIWAEKLKIVNVEWFRNMLKICLRAWLVVESRISHNRRRDMWGLRNVIPDGYWMSGLSLHWCHHRVSAVTSDWSVGSCIRLLFAVAESTFLWDSQQIWCFVTNDQRKRDPSPGYYKIYTGHVSHVARDTLRYGMHFVSGLWEPK